MADLYDVLHTALLLGVGRIGFSESGEYTDSDLPVVVCEIDGFRETGLPPDEIEWLLHKGGALGHVRYEYVGWTLCSFRKPTGGRRLRVVVALVKFIVDDEWVDDILVGLGLGKFRSQAGAASAVYTLPYINQKTQDELEEFFHGAGVSLRPYVPPWLAGINVEPSSKRPGSKEAHFFGFG